MMVRSSKILHWQTLAVAGLACAVGTFGAFPAAAQDQNVARGQKIAQERCSKCHATGRADVSPDPKAPPFRDVGKNYPLEHLAEALAEGIVTGDNNMPEFKFGPKDINAILDYIAELSANK